MSLSIKSDVKKDQMIRWLRNGQVNDSLLELIKSQQKLYPLDTIVYKSIKEISERM